MLSCSMWFSAPSFWMGGGLESRCVSRVYGVDGAVHASLKNSTPIFIQISSNTRLILPVVLRECSTSFLITREKH